MSLLQRTATSITWNATANLISVAILFGRSVVLARLLPVKAFGTYALAGSVVGLSLIVAEFGFGDALIHRARETEDEEQAARTHFTLTVLFVLGWAALLIAASFLTPDRSLRTAILVLVAARGLQRLSSTPEQLLIRRVRHKRLAVLSLADAVLTTIAAVGIALLGGELEALLITDFISMLILVAGLYLWRPVWRPRFDWTADRVRYFLGFGRRSFAASVLERLLDRLDDLWTGLVLGQEALGLYSRAYRFAIYPRQILATPVGRVAQGTYAELKNDRLALSRAFFRTNALLVRSGFLLAGILALVAPEFIRLFIGDKWLPMLTAFRLMLVFTLFDPLKGNLGALFVAVGSPGTVVLARVAQLLVLVGGVMLLGPPLGIAGVALAVDLMLVAGIGILLWRAREHVDYSAGRLFALPAVALLLAAGTTFGLLRLPGVAGGDWRNLLLKLTTMAVVYLGALLLLERREMMMMLMQLAPVLPPRWRDRVGSWGTTGEQPSPPAVKQTGESERSAE